MDNLELFLLKDDDPPPFSESSSSLSVTSFFIEVRLLCLFKAGDPVLEPLEVTEDGVPARLECESLAPDVDDPGVPETDVVGMDFFEGVFLPIIFLPRALVSLDSLGLVDSSPEASTASDFSVDAKLALSLLLARCLS